MAAHARLKIEFTEGESAIISWVGSFNEFACINSKDGAFCFMNTQNALQNAI